MSWTGVVQRDCGYNLSHFDKGFRPALDAGVSLDRFLGGGGRAFDGSNEFEK